MIHVSDNAASNTLITAFGMDTSTPPCARPA